MKCDLSPIDIETLIAKITEALRDDISILPMDFQQILIDDLVTAFYNRIRVLMRIYQKARGSLNL